jgi:hypothetical protein
LLPLRGVTVQSAQSGFVATQSGSPLASLLMPRHDEPVLRRELATGRQRLQAQPAAHFGHRQSRFRLSMPSQFWCELGRVLIRQGLTYDARAVWREGQRNSVPTLSCPCTLTQRPGCARSAGGLWRRASSKIRHMALPALAPHAGGGPSAEPQGSCSWRDLPGLRVTI